MLPATRVSTACHRCGPMLVPASEVTILLCRERATTYGVTCPSCGAVTVHSVGRALQVLVHDARIPAHRISPPVPSPRPPGTLTVDDLIEVMSTMTHCDLLVGELH